MYFPFLSSDHSDLTSKLYHIKKKISIFSKKVFTFLEICAMISNGGYGIVAQLGERLLRM